MDELEVALPKQWGPNLKPFCHFLVVEQTPKQKRTSSSQSPLSRVLSHSDPSLSTEIVVAPLLAKIETLETEVKSLTQNINVVLNRDQMTVTITHFSVCRSLPRSLAR